MFSNIALAVRCAGDKMANVGSDLDALIHSLEYENQQYVKMIEKENQRNVYLASQEKEKQQAVTELQTLITSLEIDTKTNHKQLVHNKNTLESLKKTKTVLQAHIDALLKQLDMLQFENNEQKREFEDTVLMYEKTWCDYESKYKSLPLYNTLVETQAKLSDSEAQRGKWMEQKSQLQQKMHSAQDELDFRDWHRFCIKISQKAVATRRKKEELLAAVKEKESLQSKLKEIREKNTSSCSNPTLDSTQGMDTDDVHPQNPSTEGQEEEEPGTMGAELAATQKERGGAGDSSDQSEDQQIKYRICFLLAALFVWVAWLCADENARQFMLHPFLCPLNTL